MDILQQASELVNGDRQQSYDHPIKNFQRIADYWTTHLKNTGRQVEIKPQDVAIMMLLLKVAREEYKPKEDDRTDMAGYVLCLDKIENYFGD